jgi:hypothetical protein
MLSTMAGTAGQQCAVGSVLLSNAVMVCYIHSVAQSVSIEGTASALQATSCYRQLAFAVGSVCE